jgi:hypothetical protein
MDAIKLLHQAITARARALNLNIQEDPPELARTDMPGEVFSNAIAGAMSNEEANAKDGDSQHRISASNSPPIQIPQTRLFVGEWSVIIGLIGGAPHASPATDILREPIIERWRVLQRSAAVARTALSEKRQDDLTLMLIGPLGSDKDGEWIAMASQIERNDLVCRKLVWLPPATAAEFENSLTAFLKRTFLARPWSLTKTAEQQKLDAVSNLGPTLDRWQLVLDEQPIEDSEIDYHELVERLIQDYKP